MNFIEDFNESIETRKKFAELIKKRKDVVWVEFPPKRTFKDWNLKIKFADNKWREDEFTFDIIKDRRSKTTWNICFEVQCWWLPWKILTSKADYIVYNIGDDFWIQRRAILLSKLFFTGEKECRFIRWWDKSGSLLMLIDEDNMEKYFDKEKMLTSNP